MHPSRIQSEMHCSPSPIRLSTRLISFVYLLSPKSLVFSWLSRRVALACFASVYSSLPVFDSFVHSVVLVVRRILGPQRLAFSPFQLLSLLPGCLLRHHQGMLPCLCPRLLVPSFPVLVLVSTASDVQFLESTRHIFSLVMVTVDASPFCLESQSGSPSSRGGCFSQFRLSYSLLSMSSPR
jgi:hypothetical protein